MPAATPSTLPILLLKASSMVTLLFLAGLIVTGVVPGATSMPAAGSASTSSDHIGIGLILGAIVLIAGAKPLAGALGGRASTFAGALLRIAFTEAAGITGFILVAVTGDRSSALALMTVAFAGIAIVPTGEAGIGPAE